MKCEICKREFQDYIRLGSHIGQSHRDIGVQKYYDLYLKKDPNEGICKNPGCNNKTKFVYLTKGYTKTCGQKCAHKIRDYSHKNKVKQICKFCGKEFISKIALESHINHPNSIHIEEIQKIKEEIENNKKFKCEICNRKFKSLRGLGIHIDLSHGNKDEKIYKKATMEYYDKYLKTNPKEGSCEICGNSTSFSTLSNGYYKYCSIKCAASTWIEDMKNGKAVYMNTFISNPSAPQVELYNKIKSIYPSAILNYPCYMENKSYSLDVAIPELKIWFESDGTYWHHNSKKDLERQKRIESLGWKCIRYYPVDNINQVPSLDRIKNDINEVIL